MTTPSLPSSSYGGDFPEMIPSMELVASTDVEDDDGDGDDDYSSVGSFLKPLILDDSTVYDLAYRFSKTFKDVAANSLEQFFPTAVTRLPTGQETGHYLAAYVGLSYLRVAFIDLLGPSVPAARVHGKDGVVSPRVRRTLEKAWPIEDRLKKDNAKDLFAWIGDRVAEVVADSLEPRGSSSPPSVDMGISFCFPIKQGNLHEAILMPTGKGFAINSDLNLREALLDGYDRHIRRANREFDSDTKRLRRSGLPTLRVVAITNDTVGTLASLAYSVPSLPNSKAVMGLIVGSGCNATILMNMDALNEEKTRPVRVNQPDASEVLVSTEWTLRDSSLPLLELNIASDWDNTLTQGSSRPGFQPLEYMVGGRYIGELVRIVAHDYFKTVCGIPDEALPEAMVEPYRLTTDLLSITIASTSLTKQDLAYELQTKLPPRSSTVEWTWTEESAQVLRTIAATVQNRSAALVAAATTGLLACTGHIHLRSLEELASISHTPTREATSFLQPSDLRSPEELVVGFSGGVIQHYPMYKQHVQGYIDQILLRGGPQDGGKSIFLREASDGGIIGVGVLAGTTKGRIETITGAGMKAVEDTTDPQS
ncbi:hexokinase-1 [Nannizzia gypsea CBS 118893]|uniref:Phosphotransferase n=1 Tax=Arthroderma gypseum (strain ATCC MYA-4604 / CBS 118893) TaxID=535722 RepID=E4UQ06_ARTGP|nr:hexokinase-1 [Nannizzia gypsea CBS 118893]EFQ99140.1 hexokinase-1 [Nannizzia gypsea CBS 118893]